MSERETAAPVPTRPGFFYGYIVVIAAFIIIMSAFGVRYGFGIFFMPLLNEFGWTRAMTSGAFSLSIAFEGLMSIVMGFITDRFGPRVVLTICGISLGIGYLLMSQVHAVWQLYIFYGLIVGVGMSGVMVSLLSTVARWFKDRRGMMSGIILMGTGAGTLIAAPASNQLIAAYDWRVAYLILGGVILVVIVVAAQFLKRDPSKTGQIPYIKKTESGGPGREETRHFTLTQAVRTRQFWLIIGMDFCYAFYEFAIIVHIAPHASDLKIAAAVAASIVATLGATQMVGRVGLGVICDKIGTKKAFLIGFGFSLLVLFAMAGTEGVWMLFVLAALFGIAAGGVGAMVSPVIAEYFGLTSHGLIFGVTVLSFTLGAAVGPFTAGFIFDRTESYQLAFIVCGAVAVIGLILALFLKPVIAKQLPDR